jgi:hypothetical protein
MAPEMDEVADLFFARLSQAGLRTGVLIRPQDLVKNDGVYERLRPSDTVQALIDRIDYARSRWGSTLFYVDSNGDPNAPISAEIFKSVMEARPDVLLIPEHTTPRYYAYGSNYEAHSTSTPELVRCIYPEAFTSIYVATIDQMEDHVAELIESVGRGDILLFRSWYDDPKHNPFVKTIYEAQTQ